MRTKNSGNDFFVKQTEMKKSQMVVLRAIVVIGETAQSQRFDETTQTFDDSAHSGRTDVPGNAVNNVVTSQYIDQHALNVDEDDQDLEQHGLGAVVVVHEQVVALGDVHEGEEAPNAEEEWDGDDQDDVEVGLRGTHVALFEIVAGVEHGFDEQGDSLNVGHLINGALHESDLPFGQFGRFRATKETTTRPNPKRHLILCAHVLNHGRLSAVPGHGQLDEMTHGHPGVDSVAEPDKVRRRGKHQTEHGEDGHDQVDRVHP